MDEKDKKVTAYEIACTEIKKSIISGFYKSGDRLIEQDIAERLNLSRTPVREALKHFEIEGFLVREPYKGMIVRRFDIREIINYYQVRSVLEALCAYLVTRNADDQLKEYLISNIFLSKKAIEDKDYKLLAQLNNDFHAKLANASENDMLLQMLEKLRVYSSIMRISIWSIPDRPKTAVEEHENIVNGIVKGKKFLAAKKSIDHMVSSFKYAKLILS
ncbi:GntR family transcriptional regulator [Desulfoscipio sp. XC116]|uniref:GntR family transcriptional regulator n=1 Tax=Desulfoscipio sp. XC116 TaxID=3144975 RepID=UPI00325AF456